MSWLVRRGALLGFLALSLLFAAAAKAEEPQRVDLNHASVEELRTLPGIGPKRAQAIVEYRARRPFTRVTQLLEIRGIGRKTLARLRPLVFVGRPGEVALPRPHPLAQGAPESVPVEGDAGAAEP